MDQQPEDLAAFGRKVAQAQGHRIDTPGVDWVAYGREAQYRIGKRQGVPAPVASAAPRRPVAPPPPPAMHATQRNAMHRGVRVGGLELSMIDEPEAANRPHHLRHKSQRTSGRYRKRRTSGFRRAKIAKHQGGK